MAVSPRVVKLLEWIQNASDAAQLVQLRENLAPSSPGKPGQRRAILDKVTAEERAALLAAIEARLNELAASAPQSKAAATKKKPSGGPPKGREAREFLDELGSLLERDLDLSGNKLKTNKVKTGGDMKHDSIRFVDLYLAYKNRDGVSVKLFWRQDAADAAVYLEFHKTQTGGPKAGNLMEPRVFRLDQKEEAAELYRSELAKLAPQRALAA